MEKGKRGLQRKKTTTTDNIYILKWYPITWIQIDTVYLLTLKLTIYFFPRIISLIWNHFVRKYQYNFTRFVSSPLFVNLVKLSQAIAVGTHNLSLILPCCICSQSCSRLANEPSSVTFRTSASTQTHKWGWYVYTKSNTERRFIILRVLAGEENREGSSDKSHGGCAGD